MTEEIVKIDDASMEVQEENPTNEVKISNKQREDFTSEIYKIEIKNMGKFGFGVRKYIFTCFARFL